MNCWEVIQGGGRCGDAGWEQVRRRRCRRAVTLVEAVRVAIVGMWDAWGVSGVVRGT